MKQHWGTAAAGLAVAMLPFLFGGASATTVDNTSLAPPGVYFGAGNAGTNGHYAVSTVGSVELGLDVRQRGGSPITPTGNIYNVPTGADPSNAARAFWNFEFSVNLNADGNGSLTLGQVTPTLTIQDVTSGALVTLRSAPSPTTAPGTERRHATAIRRAMPR